MKRVFFILFLFTSFVVRLPAQEEQAVDAIIENIYDFLMEDSEEELDYSDLYDDLSAIYAAPINLNTATREELSALRFLSDMQIENLLYYVYSVGEMHTIYELQLVDGLDVIALQMLVPFVRVAPRDEVQNWNFREVMAQSKHELTARFDGTFEPRVGYDKSRSHYLGDPFYTSLKYRLRSTDKLELGLTMEHDAGEQWFGDYNKKLFDSYSGFLQINKVWKFSTIVLGDYRANFGQGLVIQQDMNLGKTAMATNIASRTRGLKRHSSTDEYNFLRGIGATAKFGGFDISAFYSLRMMDADTTGGQFSAFKTDGYHRTASECAKRRTVATHILGGNVTYTYKFFRIGATILQTWLGTPLNYEPAPYQYYYFRGSKQLSASIDYLFAWRSFNFFGETAVEGNGAVATLNGLNFAPTSVVNFVLMYRYYAKNYDVFFSNAFTDNNCRNENGFYLGTEIRPARCWKINAYADVYKTPWVTYNVNKPAQGYATLLQVDYAPNRKVNMFLRFRFKEKECKVTDLSTEPTTAMSENRKYAVRYNLVYSVLGIDFKNTIEWNSVQTIGSTASHGFLITQDVAYTLPTIDLTLSARYAYFDAPTYDNRFSVYERDVPSAGFSPSLYGTGNRWYANVAYEPINGLKLMLRVAQTYYTDDRTEIGSGLNQINAAHKTDFRVFAQYKF